jgi:hypothetical protein
MPNLMRYQRTINCFSLVGTEANLLSDPKQSYDGILFMCFFIVSNMAPYEVVFHPGTICLF